MCFSFDIFLVEIKLLVPQENEKRDKSISAADVGKVAGNFFLVDYSCRSVKLSNKTLQEKSGLELRRMMGPEMDKKWHYLKFSRYLIFDAKIIPHLFDKNHPPQV